MTLGKVLKLSMPVFPRALVIVLYYEFPLIYLHPGPIGGRVREAEVGGKQKGKEAFGPTFLELHSL